MSVSFHEWGLKIKGLIHSMSGNRKRKILGAEFSHDRLICDERSHAPNPREDNYLSPKKLNSKCLSFFQKS